MQVFLQGTPKKLNKIEFTIKFRQKDAQMPCSLNDLSLEGFLILEIWLKLKYVFVATGIIITITFLAFPTFKLFPQLLMPLYPF